MLRQLGRRCLVPLLRRTPRLGVRPATVFETPLGIRRHLSNKSVPEGSAYEVLGVGRDVDDIDLRRKYKELAKVWHPDRHQGADKEEAEKKMQEISEAFQTLESPEKRTVYDGQIDAAKTAEEARQAGRRFRAATWNTPVRDVQAELRNAKKEEAGFPPHIIAGTLAFVTGNFILVLNWLGG